VRLRSLADDLRLRTDDELRALITARPDLIRPVPGDITALAAAATSGVSVSRALEDLGAPELHVLAVAARLAGEAPVGADQIAEAAIETLPDAGAARAYAEHLRAIGLLWGPLDALRTITAIRELSLGNALDAAVTWPRPQLRASAQTSSAFTPAFVDEQAGLAAVVAVAHARETLDACAVDWPAVLRAGGMSIRDFGALAKHLGSTPGETAFWVELSAAAGLLASDENPTSTDPAAWVPTEAYDTWLAKSNAQRWIALITAWLDLPRIPSRADGKTPILHSDDDRKAIPRMRAAALAALAELEPGMVVDAASLKEVLADRHPRRSGPLQDAVVDAVLHEGALLGALGAGSLGSAMRVLITGGSTKDAEKSMAASMPAEVDHVFLQGDLTMIAPGPLVASLAKPLRVLADVESRGHATVYRLSPESIRRAIDSGWTPEAITDLLREASATPLPQSLEYLIIDAARSAEAGMKKSPASDQARDDKASHRHHGERRTRTRPRKRTEPRVDTAAMDAAITEIRAGEAERQAAFGD